MKTVPSHRRWMRAFVWSAFVMLTAFLLMAFLWASTTNAQEFDSIPIAEKFDYEHVDGLDSPNRDIKQAAKDEERKRRQESNRLRGLSRDIVEGKSPLAGNEADFDSYFRDYLFARMTQFDQASLQELGNMRSELFKVYISRGNSDEAYTRLVKSLAFEEMKKIADGNFHPAVRVNAMTIIGQLDGVLGEHNDRAPVPLAEALPYMIQHLGNAATPDYLKATALAGILRHAQIDGQKSNDSRMPAPMRDQVVSQMVTILNTDASETNPALRQWMERQAVRVLGAMRMPGNNNAAAKAVYSRLSSDGTFWLRSDAAEAYGMMKFGGAADVNADEASMKMAELAIEAARYELAYLAGVKDKLADLEKWRAGGGQANEEAQGFSGFQGGGDDGRDGGGGKGGTGGGGKGMGAGAPAGAPGEEGAGGKGGGAGAPAGAPGGRGGRGGRAGGRGAAALAQGGGGGKGAPGGGGKGGGAGAPAGPPGSDSENEGFGGFATGGFSGGFGGGGNVDVADPNALPNYVSLVSRRRLKTIVGSVRLAVGDAKDSSAGLLSNVNLDDATKQDIAKIRKALDEIMSATDVGLDGTSLEDGEDPNEAYIAALEDAANELESLCNTIQGAGAANPLGAPAAAEESSGLPNN